MKENGILARTASVNKTYSFNESHNPRIPVEYWYQNTPEGLTLFVVFFTQACRYSKCAGCNLPSRMSIKHVAFNDIMKQVDALFDFILDSNTKQNLKKIIVSNNGSVLDEETFSTTALIYLISKINLECPNIEVLTLETRPEYVDIEELEVLARVLCEGNSPTALELAIGFEAFDEPIRNEKFKKGLSFEVVEKLLADINSINNRFAKKMNGKVANMRLKAYFMLKPVPELTDIEAIQDIQNGIDYLSQLANKYQVAINMHLNPTYVAKGTNLETLFYENKYQPPTLEHTMQVVKHAQNKNLTIFIGLSDEGLAVEGGSFIRDLEKEAELISKLEMFNISQDFNILEN
jgi:radical SAM enzyme (TIGR01210 family)